MREEIDISLTLEGHYRVISACLFPNLVVSCILGVDFLCKFGLALDFATVEWYFADNLAIKYAFKTQYEISQVHCRLSELTPSQTARLAEFLKNKIPETVGNPDVTSLMEHVIDVGQHLPIKQLCYLVSPKVQEAIREEVDKMLAAGIIAPSFNE